MGLLHNVAKVSKKKVDFLKYEDRLKNHTNIPRFFAKLMLQENLTVPAKDLLKNSYTKNNYLVIF
jgi:hypothetical protein